MDELCAMNPLLPLFFIIDFTQGPPGTPCLCSAIVKSETIECAQMLPMTGLYRIGVIEHPFHSRCQTNPDMSSCKNMCQLWSVEGVLALDLYTVSIRGEVKGQLTHELLMYQNDLYGSHPWHLHLTFHF